ncbi:hypothetical protein BG74_03980 [Sodalis-like endosymbiont of Proechinophthirus fluctus]|uniref:hypothetical protein n=1 Tax=Sodalis-like endosymbiont of Proechinophthirus fluctus TaxID=1462730 RepID=UPI0007A873AD|nr:hypothetical protein BG74_03980 [Sodalis-like endosymbiont of Proechinophthirus fluctus]
MGAFLFPNSIAALIICMLMGMFLCIDMNSAYKAIYWPSLILIVSTMPFALALGEDWRRGYLSAPVHVPVGRDQGAYDDAEPVYPMHGDRAVYFQYCRCGVHDTGLLAISTLVLGLVNATAANPG